MSVAQTVTDNHTTSSPVSTDWQIDPTTSRIEFTIRKRLFVAPLQVTGRFSDVHGIITLDEQDLTSAHASVTIAASSVDTGNARRDTHLRAADFFHVDTHPAITFSSRRIESSDLSPTRYTVVGDLTVRGVTREVSLDADYTAPVSSGDSRRMKLTLTGSLNRRDFGLVWNTFLISVAGDLVLNLMIEATPAR